MENPNNILSKVFQLAGVCQNVGMLLYPSNAAAIPKTSNETK